MFKGNFYIIGNSNPADGKVVFIKRKSQLAI